MGVFGLDFSPFFTVAALLHLLFFFFHPQ